MFSPRVCGNDNQVCSSTDISHQLTAHVYQITHPAYAYFGLSIMQAVFQNGPLGQPAPSELLSINTETNVAGTPVTDLHLGAEAQDSKLGSPAMTTSVAVFLDGTRVYASEKFNNSVDIVVLSGGPSP